MIRRNKLWSSLLCVVAVIFLAGSLTGCASLRKKFTRVKKNKDQKEEFIPVLEPVEYKKVEETPQQVYGGHYTMVKMYFKDLWDVLGKPNGGEKREKYIFTQLLTRLDAMAALLSEEKKAQASDLKERVLHVLMEYDKPSGMRRYDLITGPMHGVERDLYKAFKPDAVAGAFLPAGK
jgi:hypothetical protein